jgi:HEAT repeat protein
MLDLGEIHDHARALDKGDDTCRRQAINSLRDYGEEEWATAPAEVIHSLVESLQQQLLGGMQEMFIRQKVVTILGNMGPRAGPAIPQLIELLREGNPDGIREAAAAALGKIGREARVSVDQLIQVLLHCRPPLAVQVVRALGDIGCADQRVRSALVNLWLSPTQSSNSQVQVAIALCKLQIDARGLLKVLTSTLVANQDASLRKSAAQALAWCGKDDVDVVPALLKAALTDKDENVRQTAEAGLAQLRLSHEKAMHLCSKQLKDSSHAEMTLRNGGRLAVPALIEALGMEDPTTRVKAARTLGCLGELAGGAVPALTTALRDKDVDVRLAAVKSLWNITKNGEVVVPVLVDLLEVNWARASDVSESRRRHLQTVIEALGRIGPLAEAAIPALIGLTKDKNRHVSESAFSALKGIAPTVAKRKRPSKP